MEIKIMLKPEWISWDDIHSLLLIAHQKNIKKGITMAVPQLSGEDFHKKLGSDGQCLVALDHDTLVGTTSMVYYKGTHWYDKGKFVAYSMGTGILPNYQGLGIAEELYRLRDIYVREKNVDLMRADTAENNVYIRKTSKHDGWVDVDFISAKSGHYSVVFVKWLTNCPFTEAYINRKFRISKFLTKLQYKPGRIERSKVLTIICRLARRIIYFY